ncbi:MAG: serine hydrolase domain-containing protein [Pseudomonadota bacterium]
MVCVKTQFCMTAVLFLSLQSACSSTAFSTASNSGQSLQNDFEAIIESYVADDQFAGSVLIAAEGDVIYTAGSGVIDRELNVPASADQRFVIGSITKGFTAALILQLVEEGQLDLGAPAIQYWPDFPDPSGGRILVDHLLTHRSGLHHWNAVDNFLSDKSKNRWSQKELVRLYAREGLRFEPGAENAYSSIGYVLLGVLAEKVTGKPLEKLLEERIFSPLGMSNTRLDDGASIIPGRVRAYRYNFVEARYDNAEYRDPSTTWSTGGIVTTVADLNRWAQALHGANPDVVSNSAREKMFDPAAGRQAYGWAVEITDETKFASHGGLVTGYRSHIQLDLTNHRTVILLGNLRDARVSEAARALLAILDGDEPVLARKSLMKEILRVSASRGSDAAIARFNEIIEDENQSYNTQETELLLAALELRSDGVCVRAAPLYDRWIGVYPESAYMQFAMAGAIDCHLQNGHKESARNMIEALRSINPENDALEDFDARLSQS